MKIDMNEYEGRSKSAVSYIAYYDKEEKEEEEEEKEERFCVWFERESKLIPVRFESGELYVFLDR